MVYFYAIFIAGYFLLPMAAGHRRLYYILVFPAVLLLWRQLWAFYRGNLLAALMLIYCLYMVASLAWTADFNTLEALLSVWYAVAMVSFVFVSGFLWQQYPDRMDLLARRAIWLAAGAAIVSTLAWYIDNPFPDSRLVPLGVMHHPNKAASAYGVYLVLCMYYAFGERGRDNRTTYPLLGVAWCS